MGYTPSKEGESAEIVIVNSCTVTESADASSRHQIRQLAKKNPGAKMYVTGCFADRSPEEVAAIEGVTGVVGNGEKHTLLQRLFPGEKDLPEFNIKRFEAHTRAFVKVQDGCNSFCTYCIIPYVRGRSRSRSMGEIVEECQSLIANGYKEIVLTGINIGDFDGNATPPVSLATLVREIDGLPGLERLRISSIDPDEVDDDLLDAVINGQKTCHSMHIVLQSGSNVVLKRMNRKYTRNMFFDTVERLVKSSSDFTFTTDIIVGFPGETERDHQETLEAMRRVKFAKVHMFPYSDRPGTKASQMENKVPPELIHRRKMEVMRLAEQTAYELREGYVGKTLSILTERGDAARAGEISGHTDNFLQVWVPSKDLSSNQIVEVELVENSPEGLIGRAVKQSMVGRKMRGLDAA